MHHSALTSCPQRPWVYPHSLFFFSVKKKAFPSIILNSSPASHLCTCPIIKSRFWLSPIKPAVSAQPNHWIAAVVSNNSLNFTVLSEFVFKQNNLCVQILKTKKLLQHYLNCGVCGAAAFSSIRTCEVMKYKLWTFYWDYTPQLQSVVSFWKLGQTVLAMLLSF